MGNFLDFIQILKEAGCSRELLYSFSILDEAKNFRGQNQLIRSYRQDQRNLLLEVRRQLICIDYLIVKLESE